MDYVDIKDQLKSFNQCFEGCCFHWQLLISSKIGIFQERSFGLENSAPRALSAFHVAKTQIHVNSVLPEDIAKILELIVARQV